jgi:GT2 family glycosyltransferase/glycosyltransferase involved in cell wall biosynthesis
LKKDLVTFVIPSFNYQRYLGGAIDSILAQTYRHWELIVVDDASSDESPTIIEHYRRRYPDQIRGILLHDNVGQAEAVNLALRSANGEFISLLGADDVARPTRLDEAVPLLRQRADLAGIFSRVAYIDGDGRLLPVAQGVFNRGFEDLRWQLLEGNFLCAPSAVLRHSSLLDIGGFNRSLRYTEDYDLWLRLLDRSELMRVDSTWVDYRLHGKNLSLAANSDEQALGPLYESVMDAVRAMHRWPLDRLHRFRSKPGTEEHRRETASVQLRLAECCLRLDDNFFRQVREAGIAAPGIGVSAAYEFVLDALQNDPANDNARSLLARIYSALGDIGRAAGGKSSTLGQLQAVRAAQANAEASTPAEAIAPPPASTRSAYESWLGIFDLNRVEAAEYDRLATAGGLTTRFHLAVILPVGRENDLVATLKSLTAQLHTNVLLTVIASVDAPSGFGGERLRWRRSQSQPLEDANESLIREESTWVGLIECGDRLADTALLQAAAAIDRNPAWQAMFSDDDQVTPDGSFTNPRLKPDFDLTLARSIPYLDSLVLVRWDVFTALGGFDPASASAANHDLLLKISERGKSPPIGHLAGPLLHRATHRATDAQALRRALESHLARTKTNATIAPGGQTDTFALRYGIAGQPLVSLIVTTRNRLPQLSRCLESILEKTTYQPYEIIVVDHGGDSPESAAFIGGLASLGESHLRVVRQDGPFSLAALMNAGAREARGEHVVFLHDDVAALHPEWLQNLVGHAQRPGVGAVGARLLSSDGRLQHAGIVLGLSGLADLVGGGAAMDEPGYLNRYACDQEVAAASAACLLVRRSAFDSISGFDEDDYPVFLSDVDFCLRLAEADWRIVWTPQATLLHDGPMKLAEGIRSAPGSPAERKSAWMAESERLLKRWLPTLARDPHYSRLHSLHAPAFRTCEDPLLARDMLPWKPLPRIFVQPADRHACGHYRLSAPLRALATAGKVQGWDSMDFYDPVEMARIEADTVVLQRPYTDAQFAFLEQTANHSGASRMFDLDDLITLLPEKSVHRGTFPSDLAERLKRAASRCNRLVVSTAPLAKAIKDWHDDIRVVPNYLPKTPWMNLVPQRRHGERPRVGWAGALGHEGDLALVAEVIASLAKEVDWILLGHCPEALRGQMKEVHAPVSIGDYPAALADMAWDVAIAPLEINAFNEAKSSLKLLEYGALGYPVVCTDIVPYQGDFPVTRVRNRAQDWVKAIRALAFDPALAAEQGTRLRDHVREFWMLEDHLDAWLSAWLGDGARS